jgi:hypothetical protein
MAHVRNLPGMNDNGFDSTNDLLVLPVGKTSDLYLVDTSPLGTAVVADDPGVATVLEKDETRLLGNSKKLRPDERGNPVSRLTVKGLRVGSTTLRSQRTVGSEAIDPIEVRVVPDPDYRQAGEKRAITPEFRAELQGMELRDAVLRVAEDQMNSKIGRNGGGFGRYAEKQYDWCGAFAWYCWDAACDAHGVPNPFGAKYNSLLSVQKAISWALQTDSCTILRYKGGDPYGNSFTTGKPLAKGQQETQEYIEIGPANPVEPADIVLVRAGTANGWKHVALVEKTPDGNTVESIDGNQGNPCIRRRSRNMKEKIGGKDYTLVFLHVHI